MRQILVDHARARQSEKRGASPIKLGLEEVALVSASRGAELIALDDALQRLATIDERKSEVVVMRFFGGLSVEETAEVMGVSRRTIDRQWQTAKAWLHREMEKAA